MTENIPRKNQNYTASVTDRNNLGYGVCRVGGKVVFVPRCCEGDEIELKIIKTASDYCVGRVERLLHASSHRVEANCPSYNRCGGCTHRDVKYEYELELKRRRVEAAFRKAGIDAQVEQVRTAGDPDGYRNKVQLPVGIEADSGVKIGFYAPHSHDIIPVTRCVLQRRELDEVIDTVCTWIKKKAKLSTSPSPVRAVRHIYLRVGSGGVMVCLVVRDPLPETLMEDFTTAIREKCPQIVSVLQNINPEETNVILGDVYIPAYTDEGQDKAGIYDDICGLRMFVSPASFYQVNRSAAELAYSLIAEFAALNAGDRLCDIYSGIGTIGLAVAGTTPGIHLSGLEIVPQAVEDAKANAAVNGISAEFFCADASDPDDSTAGHILRGADAVIVDPPRKGCSPSLIKALISASPEKICYLSCDPETLARDVSALAPTYTLVRTVPVDFFPRTGHVETVVLMSKVR